ncbi:Uncharacterised protein [Streptococcus pneumoniae]|nr:Uncharacterised protein [Streptococcus pneumoniae]
MILVKRSQRIFLVADKDEGIVGNWKRVKVFFSTLFCVTQVIGRSLIVTRIKSWEDALPGGSLELNLVVAEFFIYCL